MLQSPPRPVMQESVDHTSFEEVALHCEVMCQLDFVKDLVDAALDGDKESLEKLKQKSAENLDFIAEHDLFDFFFDYEK